MKKKGPKGKDLTVFVRFGGVNLKKQKGFSSKNETYHSPPAPRGFYAFPKVAQEFFLIGSMGKFQPGTIPKENIHPAPHEHASDEEWKAWDDKLLELEEAGAFEDYAKRKRRALSAMRKEFRRKDGNVWSHLTEYIKRSEVIEEKGSWVKTSMKEWRRAFAKMTMDQRLPEENWWHIKSINEAKGILGHHSMDHCEVFFDEKV